MAAKNFYIKDAFAPGSQHASLADGVDAAITAVGGGSNQAKWNLTTAGANKYSEFSYTDFNLSGWTNTALPNAAPTTTDCFRSENKYNGVIASGDWTVNFNLDSDFGSQVVLASVRLWRGSAKDGSNAVELTAGHVDLNTASIVNGTAASSSGTINLAAKTFTNEYLFVQMALRLNSGTVSGVHVYINTGSISGSTSKITTPSFTGGTSYESTISDTCHIIEGKWDYLVNSIYNGGRLKPRQVNFTATSGVTNFIGNRPTNASLFEPAVVTTVSGITTARVPTGKYPDNYGSYDGGYDIVGAPGFIAASGTGPNGHPGAPLAYVHADGTRVTKVILPHTYIQHASGTNKTSYVNPLIRGIPAADERLVLPDRNV